MKSSKSNAGWARAGSLSSDEPMTVQIEAVAMQANKYQSNQPQLVLTLEGLGRKSVSAIDFSNLTEALGTNDPSEYRGRRIRVCRETGNFDTGTKEYLRIMSDRVDHPKG